MAYNTDWISTCTCAWSVRPWFITHDCSQINAVLVGFHRLGDEKLCSAENTFRMSEWELTFRNSRKFEMEKIGSSLGPSVGQY